MRTWTKVASLSAICSALILLPVSYSKAIAEVSFDANRLTEQVVNYIDRKFRDSNKYRDLNDEYLFFEGNHCSQNIVGSLWTLPHGQASLNVKDQSWFKNDEARSVLIRNARRGERLVIFDNPDAKTNDDFTEIHINSDIGGTVCIGTFEANHDNEVYSIIFHRDNGLDGKVSHVRNY